MLAAFECGGHSLEEHSNARTKFFRSVAVRGMDVDLARARVDGAVAEEPGRGDVARDGRLARAADVAVAPAEAHDHREVAPQDLRGSFFL